MVEPAMLPTIVEPSMMIQPSFDLLETHKDVLVFESLQNLHVFLETHFDTPAPGDPGDDGE